MPKKHKTAYAVDSDDNLFVMAAAIMSPLCALIDGLPITYFEKSKHMYLSIDVAIEWCRKECEVNPQYAKKAGKNTKGTDVLAGLKRAKSSMEDGTAIINE